MCLTPPAPSLCTCTSVCVFCRYVSARYKDFPYWFGGDAGSKRDVVEFIQTYNSMRHVEIPGEGPSPFSRKKADVMEEVVQALGGAGGQDKDEI